jgi:hypothetical protein
MPPVDLDALVNKAVANQFAEPVTYDPRVSAPSRGAFATRGIFERDHEVLFQEIAQSENQAAGHSTFVPMLGVRTVELALEPKKGDRITIRGVVYEVFEPQSDGDGWFELMLRKRV